MTRRLLAVALLWIALAGCGGSGGGPSSGESAKPLQGTLDARVINSGNTGTPYRLDVYLPPASAGPRSGLPVVYVLDGESWFGPLVNIVESARTPIIIVAINTSGQRSRDFVPANLCTSGGGGQAAYFDFLRQELFPYVEGAFGGDPTQRVLFGHSHGGSFVLYALFAEIPGQHSFKAYLASDASISCMSPVAYSWEQDYAARFSELPVRLHLSYATLGNYTANVDYSVVIAQRHYRNLVYIPQAYSGTHTGIVPQVLTDAIPFALASGD